MRSHAPNLGHAPGLSGCPTECLDLPRDPSRQIRRIPPSRAASLGRLERREVDLAGVIQISGHGRHGVLQPGRTVIENHALVPLDPAVGERLPVAGEGRRARCQGGSSQANRFGFDGMASTRLESARTIGEVCLRGRRERLFQSVRTAPRRQFGNTRIADSSRPVSATRQWRGNGLAKATLTPAATGTQPSPAGRRRELKHSRGA